MYRTKLRCGVTYVPAIPQNYGEVEVTRDESGYSLPFRWLQPHLPRGPRFRRVGNTNRVAAAPARARFRGQGGRKSFNKVGRGLSVLQSTEYLRCQKSLISYACAHFYFNLTSGSVLYGNYVSFLPSSRVKMLTGGEKQTNL